MTTTPLELKHIKATIILSTVYMIYNFIYTKTHKSIYPGWTWDSIPGVIKPMSVWIGSIVVHYIVV